ARGGTAVAESRRFDPLIAHLYRDGLTDTASAGGRPARVFARPRPYQPECRPTMQNLDQHDAETLQRAALECEAIRADLERLKTMIGDAGDRLLASFNVVAALVPQAQSDASEQGRLNGAIGSAVTALQFQDMANQLTAHAQRRLGKLQETLAR